MITLKKNIVPAFKKDIESSITLLKRIKSELYISSGHVCCKGIPVDFGFEAIVRYKDMSNLLALQENLKQCEGFQLSLHAPLNHDNPETVDLTTSQGFGVLEQLVEFCDKQGIPIIATHPNALRQASYFSLEYSRQHQQEKLGQVISAVQKLNQMSGKTQVCLENKPYPATDANFEGILYSPVAASFPQLLELRNAGIPLCFDTAHYATTRATANSMLAPAELKEGGLGIEKTIAPLQGFFLEDCVSHPEIPDVLVQLGDAVKEIHHNDAVHYKCVEGSVTYWERLVPGRGSLVNNSDVSAFIKSKKDLPVVLEVYETDYANNPNSYLAFRNLLIELSR